jgi:hypothetical protein
MRPAVIEVHIDELVLRGVAPVDRAALAATLEAELGRLLQATDGRDWASASGARPSLDGGSVEVGADAGDLGTQLAATLHATLAALTGGGA